MSRILNLKINNLTYKLYYKLSNYFILCKLKSRQSTIKELHLVYSTQFINETFDQQKSIDNKRENINNECVKNNPPLNQFCSIVGSQLQVIYYILK